MTKTEKVENAITVENITKTFKLPHEDHAGLKQRVTSAFRKNKKKGYETQKVLKGISFEIKKGEFIGIVGRNGSGKSTLLKMLAGIYTPDSGKMSINGSLVPFIELGVGFNPELTGRENVFLNGALLGFSREEMEEMYEDIVEFAELERFMDQKLKNYSSGMQVRLAFSIAIRADADILLLDEVLAVGDANFQAKCLSYFHELKNNKKTVIFISHNMSAVQEFCDRVVVLNKGKITFNGDPREAASLYNLASFESSGAKQTEKDGVKHRGTGDILIDSITVNGIKNEKQIKLLTPKETFVIQLRATAKKEIKDLLIGVQVIDAAGGVVFSVNNKSEKDKFKNIHKNDTVIYKIKLDNVFNDGTYTLAAALKSQNRAKTYDDIKDVGKFDVAGWDVGGGVHVDYTTEIEITNAI